MGTKEQGQKRNILQYNFVEALNMALIYFDNDKTSNAVCGFCVTQ